MGDLTAHFDVSEFACRDGTPVPAELLPHARRTAEMLEFLRRRCGDRPVEVVSGYRTPAWNRRVGGVPGSWHLSARAADVRVAGLPPGEVQRIALGLQGGSVGGIGRYDTFTHLDWGPRRTWDRRTKGGP